MLKELKKLIKEWDAGEIVWTMEMGGMGPGYEQAIQITTFELLRFLLKKKVKKEEKFKEVCLRWEKEIDEETTRLNNKWDIGLSGAQAGAAQGLAIRYRFYGHEAMLRKVSQDRKIMVNKTFLKKWNSQ